MKHGGTAGHNLRLDFRFGLGDPDRLRKYATELVALAPDVPAICRLVHCGGSLSPLSRA